MTSPSDDYDWHNDLPHPRWETLYKNIESVDRSEQSVLLTDAIDRWLRRLAAVLGPQAGILKDDDTYCLYSAEKDESQRLLKWSSAALARIIAIVGEHRTPDMVGPRIIMLFDDVDRYYDYIDRFYPDAGEFGASVGMCVSNCYYHVVVGPGGFGTRQSILSHELTHLTLCPLPLPLWLNEGIAQMMQEVVTGASHFQINRELLQRHHALWQKDGLQAFWTGEAFNCPGEMEELSYHLAEVLTRNILSAHRKCFIRFLASADWRDAGEGAAQQVLGRNLGDFAAEFLGRGNWNPQPVRE